MAPGGPGQHKERLHWPSASARGSATCTFTLLTWNAHARPQRGSLTAPRPGRRTDGGNRSRRAPPPHHGGISGAALIPQTHMKFTSCKPNTADGLPEEQRRPRSGGCTPERTRPSPPAPHRRRTRPSSQTRSRRNLRSGELESLRAGPAHGPSRGRHAFLV